MVAMDLLLKATEWGVQVVQAASTKAQKRTADVVEKSAVLVAGLRHMDARFSELFVPLVFYRRRLLAYRASNDAWAEDALGMHPATASSTGSARPSDPVGVGHASADLQSQAST